MLLEDVEEYKNNQADKPKGIAQIEFQGQNKQNKEWFCLYDEVNIHWNFTTPSCL